MDVIPAGLRSEVTSRYIAACMNTPVIVQVRYAFPNGWGAHVRYDGGVAGPTPEESERWDVVPGFASDSMLMATWGPITRRRLSSRDVELALLEVRGYRSIVADIRPYVQDLWTWSHPASCECGHTEPDWREFASLLGDLWVPGSAS